MTGKSPSTTGAGSEGALTKGPFNMLPSIIDLNAAFLSYALTGYDGWISSAGYIGPKVRVDHDFSLLVPEVFSRMSPAERDAAWLVENGYLDPIRTSSATGRPSRRAASGTDQPALRDRVLRPDLPPPRDRLHARECSSLSCRTPTCTRTPSR